MGKHMQEKDWSHTLDGLWTCHGCVNTVAHAQEKKPNILFIVSDDTGYGDLGPYGGGEGRGMPTPNIDRMASEGHDVLLFLRAAELYAWPSRYADRTHPEP